MMMRNESITSIVDIMKFFAAIAAIAALAVAAPVTKLEAEAAGPVLVRAHTNYPFRNPSS